MMSTTPPSFDRVEYAASPAALAPAAAMPKAVLYGVVAAVLGSLLYAGVEISTGWTIGYVALAVGWLIGKGMLLGSEGRGGRPYQVVAVVLTYLSVAVAGLLVILHSVQKQDPTVHFRATPRFAAFCAQYGLLSPFLDLRSNFVGGAIGLFILFIGMRTAWTLTAGPRATPTETLS